LKPKEEIIMKIRAYSILAVAALFATVLTPARARSEKLISANVPFNFFIRDRALPAGEYLFAIVQLGGGDAIKIQSADGHITAFVPTLAAKAKASKSEPNLVFNRYGDQYFLSQVCGLEESATQNLARARAEDRLARRAAEPRKVPIAAHDKD